MENGKQLQLPKWLLALSPIGPLLFGIGFIVEPSRQVWNIWKIAGIAISVLGLAIIVVLAVKNNKKG